MLRIAFTTNSPTSSQALFLCLTSSLAVSSPCFARQHAILCLVSPLPVDLERDVQAADSACAMLSAQVAMPAFSADDSHQLDDCVSTCGIRSCNDRPHCGWHRGCGYSCLLVQSPSQQFLRIFRYLSRSSCRQFDYRPHAVACSRSSH